MPRSRPALGQSVLVCLWAAGLIALLDVAIAVARNDESIGAPGVLYALATAWTLYSLPAAACGLAVGLLFAAAPPLEARTLLRRLREDQEWDRRGAAGLWAASATLLLWGGILYLFLRRIALEMASHRNAALATALFAVASLPIVGWLWFPCFRLTRLTVQLLPRPRTLITLGLLALFAAGALVAAIASVDWRAVNFGATYAISTFLVAAVVLSRWRSAHLLLPVAALLPLAALGTAHLASYPAALALVGEQTFGARPLFHLLQHLTDRDQDGFSALLGGGDCDDRNPDVYPGAIDPPGDGIDQDCSGEDTRPRPPAVVAATPSLPTLRFDGNLVFITIDTLRADRVNDRVMPHLAGFAKSAARFTHVYAQAPNTPRSFPSFLTARFSSHIAWQRRNVNFSPITDENTTLFEVLHQAGYRTIGIFSHFYMTRENGLAQGFDEWDNAGALTLHDSNTDVAAPRITARVERRLAELGASRRRFALWTHLFEPHSRYMDHPEFPVHGSSLAALEKRYDGEVSFVDLHLQRIFAALERAGLEGNTAVVIFADHGESFGEHRFAGQAMYFHGETLYDEALRVPLIVRVPNQTARTIDDPLMLIDLAPTITELVGAPLPPSFEGRSLTPALAGLPLTPRPVYAELLPAPAWNHSARLFIQNGHKLLHKVSENSIELYDLAADPDERKNMAYLDLPRVTELRRALGEWLAQGSLALRR